MIDYLHGAPVPCSLDVDWHHGSPSPEGDPGPRIQVHACTEHTLILRQNKSVHFEAPFLFLLFGNDRALLLDTGASEDAAHFPLRATVDALTDQWLLRHPRERYGLLVAHTHGHGDHVAGDAQFAGRPLTTVVGRDQEAVAGYFGLTDWPHRQGELDLGGRVVDLIPGPGHQSAAVVFHDRHTGLLLTGDSLYPGRIHVSDEAAFTATVERLLAFCADRPVTHVLGCHIEMTTTPHVDYPRGTAYQPDEPPLQLTAGHLQRLRQALADGTDDPQGEFLVVTGCPRFRPRSARSCRRAHPTPSSRSPHGPGRAAAPRR
ncbi:MBL fold metallo-hydrolase [Streptomyces sp. NBC_00388]|uniref:MBL fold metallo-hydrolase n=1 Tax=Streptomyces sp. NBC_00388 TaxID=2975735 RepID=UPI002E248948